MDNNTFEERALEYIEEVWSMYRDALEVNEIDIARRICSRYITLTDMFETVTGKEITTDGDRVIVGQAE